MKLFGYLFIMVLGGLNVYLLSLVLPEKLNACYFSGVEQQFLCYGQLHGFIAVTTIISPLVFMGVICPFRRKVKDIHFSISGMLGLIFNVGVLLNASYL